MNEDCEYQEFDDSPPQVPSKEWKYLFYLVDTDQPTFNLLNAEGAGISEEEARECFDLIEFVPVSTLHDVIYDLAHRPYLSNSMDAYHTGQFYHMLYFTKEGDEIDARSKAFSFENTDELAELMLNGNIRSILSLIQYDRVVGIQHVLSNYKDTEGGDSRADINQISMYVIGNDNVVIPMEYVEHFKVLRVKDERELMATQFKFHPDPPYYVEYKDGKLLLRHIYEKFDEFTVYDLLDESFEEIIRIKDSY
ncbi:hypothetical protein Cantr_00243 [Candida viswanathii]|uniref:Uncharacterized protein n=1 Tax=Candida viswanathii TaxID=5486 RepID=A0A367YFJ1_9ASCO|nr:hypothetical protein Cantr_00243 [Candida viswanathii]